MELLQLLLVLLFNIKINMFEFTFNNPSFEQSVIESSIVTNGLVLYLDAGNRKSFFNGQSTCYDLTTNEDNGQLNGVIFTSSYGGIFRFNGSSYIDCLSSTGSSVTGYFSVNFWFNTAANASNGDYTMWTTRTPANYGTDFALNSPTFGLHCDLGNGGSFTSCNVTYNFTSSIWYNICAIFTTSSFSYYSNAKLIGSGTFSAITPILIGPNNMLSVGGYSGLGFFSGSINTFQVYNRALTINDVAQNFSASKQRYGYL